MIRIALILLISLSGTRIFSQDAKLIYKNAVNSTVTIETDKGLGSGFFVGNNIIATNYHVIEGATTAYCYLNNSSTKYNIEGFLAIDTAADLVLLKVEGLNRISLKMATKTVEVGQKIFVLGSPKGLPATISDGLVSGLRNVNGHKFIQITAPMSPGSSGGPILNSNGELVGISVGQINGGQNLNFAIPKSYLQVLLTSKKSTIERLTNLPTAKVSSNRSKIETKEAKNIIQMDAPIFRKKIVKDFRTPNEQVIEDKVLGIDVSVLIDTIFNKYTVLFTNANGEKESIVFSFIRQPAQTTEPNPLLKYYYYMEFDDEVYLLIHFFRSSIIEIRRYELLKNNSTAIYEITNLAIVK